MSDKFPPNWAEISLDAKRRANFCCEECGQPGYRPGDEIVNRAFILDTHHINRDRSCNSQENLRVLCKSCHGRSHSSKCFTSQQLTHVKQLVLTGLSEKF